MEKKGLNDKWARIIGIPIIAALIILFSKDPWIALPLNLKLIKFLKNAFFITIYWETNRMIFLYLRNKYPRPNDFIKKVIAQGIIFVVYILIVALVIDAADRLIPDPDPETFWQSYLEIVKKSGFLLAIITICYECAYFFGKWEHTLYESERLQKESLLSQFELLKNQISPHFLFNSLNALITLVPEDPKLSVIFIQKLSNVYRHVLNYNEKQMIKLSEELEFLRDYIFLFEMRFGENLRVEYRLSEIQEDVQIVPFTLQMLVENAIKHNIISHKKPLHILISMEDDSITVLNNLQIKTSGVESTHTGLQNITNRYKLLTNKAVAVVISQQEFSVSLPLLHSNQI